MRISDWSSDVCSSDLEVITPATPDEVAVAVRRAATAGDRVKMVGTGHSFTSISAPESVMLRPDGLSGITAVDRAAMTVTALAGTRSEERRVGTECVKTCSFRW